MTDRPVIMRGNTPSSAEALQADLLLLFQRYGLSVAVGLTAKGVAIRSQDERVDACNVGRISTEN